MRSILLLIHSLWYDCNGMPILSMIIFYFVWHLECLFFVFSFIRTFAHNLFAPTKCERATFYLNIKFIKNLHWIGYQFTLMTSEGRRRRRNRIYWELFRLAFMRVIQTPLEQSSWIVLFLSIFLRELDRTIYVQNRKLIENTQWYIIEYFENNHRTKLLHLFTLPSMICLTRSVENKNTKLLYMQYMCKRVSLWKLLHEIISISFSFYPVKVFFFFSSVCSFFVACEMLSIQYFLSIAGKHTQTHIRWIYYGRY